MTSIEDYLGNTTTFSYSGGYLQSIEDPASRFTTFTHSGGNLDPGRIAGRVDFRLFLRLRWAVDQDHRPSFELGHHQL